MIDRCATLARERGDDLAGTASRARRWLLVEQPGPWGPEALHQSLLPPDVAAHLRVLARSLPARVLLLRRTGGLAPDGQPRTVLVGHSDAAGGWLERFALDDIRDLLDLELSALATGHSVGGEPVHVPQYLVCTNGRKDPCCAEFGLPVARSLTALLGDRVWECSHVGGDRFAGNLVCLPDGLFYGALDPETARQAVAANEAGSVLLERYRGRSAVPFVVQAAESFVRRALQIHGVRSIRAVAARREGHDHQVRFRLDDGRDVLVSVREIRTEPRVVTCGGIPSRTPRFELVALEAATPG